MHRITLYILLAFFVSTVVCSKKKEEIIINHITGTRCTDCRSIFSAETTTYTSLIENVTDKLLQLSNRNFILDYKDTLCMDCITQRKIDGDILFRAGMKAYNSKDYTKAKQKFAAAIYKGNKNAASWLNKTNEKLNAIEKAKKEKAETEARKQYALKLREHFLDNNMNVKVWVSGKGNKYIHLQYVLFDEVWAHNFKKGDLILEIRAMGFKRVYLKDGYDYGVYWEW